MDLIRCLLLQLINYGIPYWILFVAVSFLSARFAGILGILVGQIAIAIAIFNLDVNWIQSEMRRPGWNAATGPDQDIVFLIGAAIRIVMVNTALLPIGATGLWLAVKSKKMKLTAHEGGALHN